MGGDSPIPAKITAKPTLVSLVVEAVTGGRTGVQIQVPVRLARDQIQIHSVKLA